MNSYGALTPVDSANGPEKLRSVACPEKPRHVCPEKAAYPTLFLTVEFERVLDFSRN